MMSHSHQGIFLDEQGVLSNIELTNILQGTVQMEKMSKRQHKRRAGEDTWKSAKRKPGDDADLLLETSSSDSTSRSTPLSQETVSEIPTPNSALGFHSDLELSGIDALELMETDKVEDFGNIDELGDVEEMLAKTSRKLQKSPSNSSLLADLGDNKGLVPPSVSITPIPTSTSPGYGGSGAGRTGIEIIPISTANSPILPSSITITPISSSQVKSEEKSREKKSSKTRSDDKSRMEKKRKRRKEESAMGPPDKLPPKQDPLSKPVSVSIKPAESPPLSNVTPTSPSMMRKFSPSPTHKSLSGKLSPSMLKSGLKASSGSHHSPKHSPAHIANSPKHSGIPGISSPKSHGTSPKHPSTSGTGKPSMSTLKNAANSPSSKSSSESSKSKSINKESSREKERKLSIFGTSNCAKVKLSSVKLKQLDLTSPETGEPLNQEGSAQCVSDKSVVPGQVRNRKGSLSAVIDKLKSAQHCEGDMKSGRERSGQVSAKSSEGSKSTSSKTGSETKNSEYMVKPSLDGMKLTINKTRMKESSKSSKEFVRSSSSSPKTHTGLKPGVNSGPASKKPQPISLKSSTNLSNSSTNYGSIKSKLSSGNKTSASLGSGLNKSSKLGSPKTNTNLDSSRNKDRPKTSKSGSEKSIFSSREGRKSSPTASRDDDDRSYKVLPKIDPYSSPLVMDGLTKQLDKNFQIPKLSARTSEERKPSKLASESVNNVNRVESSKMFDMMSKNETKYPLAIPSNKMFENVETKIRNSMNNFVSGGGTSISVTTAPKYAQKDQTDFSDASEKKKDTAQEKFMLYQASKSFPNEQPLSLSTKSDSSSKFATPAAPKDEKKDSKSKNPETSGGDIVLDFGGKPEQRLASFPQSPSVSVHIVKSPAPSPLVNPSPHSAASPSCITDDELMDEALVGLGK